MTERSYVECTGSAIAALARFRRADPGELADRVDRAIEHGVRFLRAAQRPDGAWAGFWGINFTYAAFHAVRGLRAAGVDAGDPGLTRAADWLCRVQRADGGWGEHHSGCLEGRYVEHPESQVGHDGVGAPGPHGRRRARRGARSGAASPGSPPPSARMAPGHGRPSTESSSAPRCWTTGSTGATSRPGPWRATPPPAGEVTPALASPLAGTRDSEAHPASRDRVGGPPVREPSPRRGARRRRAGEPARPLRSPSRARSRASSSTSDPRGSTGEPGRPLGPDGSASRTGGSRRGGAASPASVR